MMKMPHFSGMESIVSISGATFSDT
jgi:hypothetical protein